MLFQKSETFIQLYTHLKYFIINLERITYLASLMWLLCNQVKSRVANNVCEIDVLRPQPVKHENKKLCQMCQRAVKKTVTTRSELQENGFVLDQANFRQDAVILGGRRF